MVFWRTSTKALFFHKLLTGVVRSRMSMAASTTEISLTVPWGHIAGKSWGDASSKRRMLAVHGWLDNAGSFDKLIPLLSPDLHVVAIDWPGHGQSSHRPRGVQYNSFNYVADIQYVIDALKWDKFSLLGHSMGAGACMWFAGARPDLVEKMALIEGGAFFSYDAAGMPKMMGKVLSGLLAVDQLADDKTVPTWENVVDKVLEGQRRSQSSFSREAAAVLAVRGSKRLENGHYCFTRDLRLKQPSLIRITSEMNDSFWAAVKCPLLIIGAEDSYIQQFFLSFTEKLNPSKFQTLITVPGGHHVHLENPERISTAINDFLVNDSECQGKL